MRASILIVSIALLIAIVAADDVQMVAVNPTAQIVQTYIGEGGTNGANGAYLLLEGVTGEATAFGHEGWIDVSSFNYSIMGQRAPLSAVQNEAQLSSLGDLIVVKSLDSTSPQIYLLACNGDTRDAQLDIVRNGATVMQYILTNAVVSDVQVLGGGAGYGQKPQEAIALSYSKIEWKYTGSDTSKGPVDKTWDLVANQEA